MTDSPLSDRNPRQPHRTGTVLALLLILFLAAALRVEDLQGSYWVDEIRTWEGSTKPFSETLVHCPYPLYFVLGHLALHLGDTEAALRFPSVVCGVLGVLALYFVLRSLHGRTAGLVGALLLATCEFHVFFSREARFYALMMLAGLLMLWLLHRALVAGGVLNWVLFALASAAGILSHLFMLPFYAALLAGAVPWLLCTRTSLTYGRRMRRLIALILFGALGMSGFGAVTLALGYFPTGLISPIERNLGEAAAAAAPHPPADSASAADDSTAQLAKPAEEIFRLDWKQYLQYYADFFRQWPLHWQYILAGLGAWGLLRLWVRHRSMAALLTGLHVLMPLPFFFVTSPHFYGARYFSPLLPAAMISLAFGLTDIVFLAGEAVRWGVRKFQTRAGLPPRPNNGWCHATALVALGIVLAIAAPQTVSAFSRASAERERDYWHGDWKGAAQCIAQRMTSDDVLVYAIAEDRMWEIAYPMDFYLRRFLSNSAATLFAVQPYYGAGVLKTANLNQILERHPMSSIYFISITDQEFRPEFLARLDNVGMEKRAFRVVNVRTLGAPTANQAWWGGFEGDKAGAIAGGPLAVTGKNEAFDGEHALRIHVPEITSARMVIPFRQSPCRLRNGDLESWKDALPVGWTSHDARTVSRAFDAAVGRYSLALRALDQPAILRQALPHSFFPGDVIDVSAQGKAPAPDQLTLAVTWRTASGEPRENAVVCPGIGAWAPLALRVQTPSDAVSDSFAVELRCASGYHGEVFVDGLQLSADRQGLTFDPLQEYTLSLCLKMKDVDLFDNPMTLGIAGTDAKGEPFDKVLLALGGTRDWQSCVFQLRPGVNIPADARNAGLMLNLHGPQGIVWLDNVQLEGRGRPTPFTQADRPPHDELP